MEPAIHYRTLTIEEAEAEHPGDLSRPGLAKPFGGVNDRWERLKAAMQPGDKIVALDSPLEAWQALAGREGVGLLRDGQIVMEVVTLMN